MAGDRDDHPDDLSDINDLDRPPAASLVPVDDDAAVSAWLGRMPLAALAAVGCFIVFPLIFPGAAGGGMAVIATCAIAGWMLVRSAPASVHGYLAAAAAPLLLCVLAAT